MKISSSRLSYSICCTYDWFFAQRMAVFSLKRMLTQYSGRIYKDFAPITRSRMRQNCQVETYPIKQQNIQGKTTFNGCICNSQNLPTSFFSVEKSSYQKSTQRLRMESGSEETVLRRMKQFAQMCRKRSQIYQGEVEAQQKGAMQFAKDLQGRLPWMGANLSRRESAGPNCLMRTIWPSCLSQMKVQQILRMASLKTKQTGSLRISLESDLIICFHIFSYSANSTFFPEYSQKHSKYLLQTFTLSPLMHPRHRYPSISLAMFSPSTMRFAFLSLSFRSESSSPPRMFSPWLRKAYFCFNCVYFCTFTTSFWKMKIYESRTRMAPLALTEERNCSRELESQTQVTDSSSSSYSSSLTILLAMLLNSFMIISDHFSRYGSTSGLGSLSSGSRRVLFCRQLLISAVNFSLLPLCMSVRCRSAVVNCPVILFLSISDTSSLFTCQKILLSFIRARMERVYSSALSHYMVQMIRINEGMHHGRERQGAGATWQKGPPRIWGWGGNTPGLEGDWMRTGALGMMKCCNC